MATTRRTGFRRGDLRVRASLCLNFGASVRARLNYHCEIVNESVRPRRRLDTQCEFTEHNNYILYFTLVSAGPPRRVSHRFY